MILSDRSIREELAAGRIVIDPLDDGAIQPSSVDLHVDRYFRVFRNDTTPFIDPKRRQEDLTELVEVKEEGAFILHPGEFVLGSTLERVALPDDLVARLEGKSSLGRLGLLIHSSLPASEVVFVLGDDGLEARAIGDVVRKQMRAAVVSFDPDTFRVGYHEITGWYEGPPDRIYEVDLSSGRRVRVTAGHNLFTLDDAGEIARVPTAALRAGTRVAVPLRIPSPDSTPARCAVLASVPESDARDLLLEGPTVTRAFREQEPHVTEALHCNGYRHIEYYRGRSRLPLHVARELGVSADVGDCDSLRFRGGRNALPAYIEVDRELAWFLGMYVAEGYRRENQFVVSNTDQAMLDRIEALLRRFDLPIYRTRGAITCCSTLASRWLGWLGTGDRAAGKRVPRAVFSWPAPLIEAFLDGLVDGGGSRDPSRTSIWTISEGLVGDLLFLSSLLGRRAVTSWRERGHAPVCRLDLPARGLAAGYRHASDRLVDGDLMWDTVVAVRDTGVTETIFDLEVRPGGRHIENFLAGSGGVFVSNTAGFVDAGWDGHLTLELSNVANLPIALYPGMKIGQISFLRMTTAADNPYGSGTAGSKYQGQRGPTPSRYYLNFGPDDDS